MSDGPYKSLPQPRHWKTVMRWAANPATPIGELCEACEVAIKRDYINLPISRMREIAESSLFPDMSCGQLEALALNHPGDHAIQAVIRHGIDALNSNLKGDAAIEAGIENALRETIRARCRGMEEHHERKGGKDVFRLQARLVEMRDATNLKRTAKELAYQAANVRRSSLRAPQRSGLEDGPPKP
jgi:hypothetical protein